MSIVAALLGASIGLALLWAFAVVRWRRAFHEPAPSAIHTLHGGFIAGLLALAAVITWRTP